MREQQYHVLLDKLIRTHDEKELREVIETHLTLTLHSDFDRWLLGQISELQKADAALADRVDYNGSKNSDRERTRNKIY